MMGTKKEEYGGPVCECIGWLTPFTLLFLPASFICSGLLCSFSHTFLHSHSEPFSPVLICCPSLTRLLPVFYPLCPHNLSVAPPLFPSFCIGILISLVPCQNSLETVCRMTVGNGGIIQRIFKGLKCLFWLLLIAQDAITINILAAKTGIKINI